MKKTKKTTIKAAPKEKTLSKPTLYIKYKETTYGGEVCKGQENDPWPNYETAYHEYHYEYATKNKPTDNQLYGNYTTLEVAPEVLLEDKVYLAIVVYGDGNTFGSSSGHHEIIGGFSTRKEAEELLSHVTKHGYDNRDGGFYPWNGYFNSLEGKIVIKLDIED